MNHRLPAPSSAALMLLVLVVSVLASCGISTTDTGSVASTTTPTPTPTYVPPTPTNVPAGWQVYSGPHFTIAYPPGWTGSTGAAPTDEQGVTVDVRNAQTNEDVGIDETYGYDAAAVHTACTRSDVKVTLAGIPMLYVLNEGVHRTWFFYNDKGYFYMITVLDGNQPKATQAAHDAILATFRPDDPTPGCPTS